MRPFNSWGSYELIETIFSSLVPSVPFWDINPAFSYFFVFSSIMDCMFTWLEKVFSSLLFQKGEDRLYSFLNSSSWLLSFVAVVSALPLVTILWVGEGFILVSVLDIRLLSVTFLLWFGSKTPFLSSLGVIYLSLISKPFVWVILLMAVLLLDVVSLLDPWVITPPILLSLDFIPPLLLD